MTPPTVSLIIATLNEEEHLGDCLRSIAVQTYGGIIDVFVIDGGSRDRTRAIAKEFDLVTLIENPKRIQAAAYNIGLEHARGEITALVSAHSVLEPDYVERAVDALHVSGAALVGGAITPIGRDLVPRGIALAMRSRLGNGPSMRFRPRRAAGWEDTVVFGVYATVDARRAGGYDEARAINEDAEFALRLAGPRGAWFEPTVRSSYWCRPTLPALARQFFAYGKGRAATVRSHPGSLRPRQMAAPLLVLGVLSPWRKWVLAAYGIVVLGVAVEALSEDPKAAPIAAAAAPTMHFSWGLGFVRGLVRRTPSQRAEMGPQRRRCSRR